MRKANGTSNALRKNNLFGGGERGAATIFRNSGS
jgi:hypothetical protein